MSSSLSRETVYDAAALQQRSQSGADRWDETGTAHQHNLRAGRNDAPPMPFGNPTLPAGHHSRRDACGRAGPSSASGRRS
jgi:hypothetical protein